MKLNVITKANAQVILKNAEVASITPENVIIIDPTILGLTGEDGTRTIHIGNIRSLMSG